MVYYTLRCVNGGAVLYQQVSLTWSIASDHHSVVLYAGVRSSTPQSHFSREVGKVALSVKSPDFYIHSASLSGWVDSASASSFLPLTYVVQQRVRGEGYHCEWSG